jgi:hypothetical protein
VSASPVCHSQSETQLNILPAVIVACLASFRQLFVKSTQISEPMKPTNADYSSSWHHGLLSLSRYLRTSRSKSTGSSAGGSNFFSWRSHTTEKRANSSNVSTEHIASPPNDSIYVNRQFELQSHIAGGDERLQKALGSPSITCYADASPRGIHYGKRAAEFGESCYEQV